MLNVVVTGLGAVTPLGLNLDEISDGLKIGKSGISTRLDWKERGFKVHMSGILPDFSNEFDKIRLSPRLKRSLCRRSKLALLSVMKALDSAPNISKDVLEGTNTAVIAACSSQENNDLIKNLEHVANARTNSIDPHTILRAMPSNPAVVISNYLKLKGPAFVVSSACASSNDAIGLAMMMIASGKVKRAIVTGVEILDEYLLSAFIATRAALSTNNVEYATASRPFSHSRDGFIMSEGAGALILESREEAERSSNIPFLSLMSYSSKTDPYDLMIPEETGETLALVMCTALSEAKLSLNQIDYISAHGTSTVKGDIAEANAINNVFGEHTPLVSSSKSLIGHTISASGVLDVIFTALMLKDGYVVPNINYQGKDVMIKDINLVTKPLKQKINTVMSNNLGFGGANTCLIMSR